MQQTVAAVLTHSLLNRLTSPEPVLRMRTLHAIDAGVLLLPHTLHGRQVRQQLVRDLCDLVANDEIESIQLLAASLLGKITVHADAASIATAASSSHATDSSTKAPSSSHHGHRAAASGFSVASFGTGGGGWVPHVSYPFVRALVDHAHASDSSSSLHMRVTSIEAIGYFLETIPALHPDQQGPLDDLLLKLVSTRDIDHFIVAQVILILAHHLRLTHRNRKRLQRFFAPVRTWLQRCDGKHQPTVCCLCVYVLV